MINHKHIRKKQKLDMSDSWTFLSTWGQCCTNNRKRLEAAGELGTNDVFGRGSRNCPFSYHVTAQLRPLILLTSCGWMVEGNLAMSGEMNKSAERELEMTWPFSVSKPFCHDYAYLCGRQYDPSVPVTCWRCCNEAESGADIFRWLSCSWLQFFPPFYIFQHVEKN